MIFKNKSQNTIRVTDNCIKKLFWYEQNMVVFNNLIK